MTEPNDLKGDLSAFCLGSFVQAEHNPPDIGLYLAIYRDGRDLPL